MSRNENERLRFRLTQGMRRGETESDARGHLRKALQDLIADERYQRGDADFRHHVRLQHQRVFNVAPGQGSQSPVGSLPESHATLESFERLRARRRRLDERAALEVSNEPQIGPGRYVRRNTTRALEGEGAEAASPKEPAIQFAGGGGSEMLDELPPSLDRTKRTLKAIDAIIERGWREGRALSAAYLQRYRDGEGGTDHWSWAHLLHYPQARQADATVVSYFEQWMTGTLVDGTIGAPFLDLKDGESLVLGRHGVSSPVH